VLEVCAVRTGVGAHLDDFDLVARRRRLRRLDDRVVRAGNPGLGRGGGIAVGAARSRGEQPGQQNQQDRQLLEHGCSSHRVSRLGWTGHLPLASFWIR
jgi:hypothetical protein